MNNTIEQSSTTNHVICHRLALSDKEHLVLVDTESLVWTIKAGEI